MKQYLCLAAVLVMSAAAADRPELSGTWQLDAAHSQITDTKVKTQTWSIAQKDDSVAISEAITEAGGKQKTVVIDCNTDGKECTIKEAGRPTQVTMYYNGPVLVMLEQNGTDFVTKKRIQTAADGKTLTVEVEHLAPAGRKNENLTFVKQ